MSEYLSDALIAAIVDFDPIAENAKRHEDDFDGFHCLKCKTSIHIDSSYDPCALCNLCTHTVLDALAAEIQTRRRNVELRALEVPVGKQRNVRYRGGRR